MRREGFFMLTTGAQALGNESERSESQPRPQIGIPAARKSIRGEISHI